ncbi:tumor protein p53-inducible nuclear protein 2 isoform X1 [Osmerus eperlanus]|uniref:tumor protein p53-inducible nuclear protein 2 isoform X1 n=1 Tax=Osmerus eperlanus TaxID=29151 RepID=UPI002E11DDC0
MFGKLFAHLLGNTEEEFDAAASSDNVDDTYDDLVEFEEGGWVIVRIQENVPLEQPEVDPLENMLIEHPSMSVYQMRSKITEDELLESDEDEEDCPSRPVSIKQHVSWRLAAWGSLLPCHVHCLALQRARPLPGHKRLTRSALHRQNLAKTRFSPAERRYGHFKQPSQRLFNY